MVPVRRPLNLALVVLIVAAAPGGDDHESPGLAPDHGEHKTAYQHPTLPAVEIVWTTRIVPAAVSRPSANRGKRSLGGNLTLTEIPDARFIAGDSVHFSVKGARLASTPIITTNTRSGLTAELRAPDEHGFSVRVTTPSRPSSLGVVTISSIEYEIAAEIVEGPIEVAIRGSVLANIDNAMVEL